MTTPDHSRGDQFDVPLIDVVLLEEIHLLTALMIAASEAEDHLDDTEIDRALGLSVPRPRPPAE